MNNDNQHHSNTRRRRFSHSFNIGTTLQTVFRNINHAFTNNRDSGEQTSISRDPMADMPPLDALNSTGGEHDNHPMAAISHSSGSATSTPAALVPPDASIPPPLQRDDDVDSMPDLHSVSDSSDSSDARDAPLDLEMPHQEDVPVDDHDSAWTDEEDPHPPLGPSIGTRRARVDDDGDDARDRRHPSERVGSAPPNDAAPHPHPQPNPRSPSGFFGAVFGMGPLGHLPEDAHAHTDEGADPSSGENTTAPGHAPRGAPILTAGFTLTIPLFGPQGNPAGAPGGGQGGPPPGMAGMDPATREELFASFAALFQEFQAMDEGREDPERAKKLLAGLDVVPLGLVKRLERVGGAPGGHAGDANAEASSSGCAICWDTLLDAEGDSFSGQYSASEGPPPEGENEAPRDSNAMDVDASAAPAKPETPSSNEPPQIISLPCAHVFHASCLVPWFTRARQATCPTCRFNIDPENLTYSLPPRRAFNRTPPAQAETADPNAAAGSPPVAPQEPLEAGAFPAEAAGPQADPGPAPTDARPQANPAPPFPTGPGGVPPVGIGFNPFMPGVPVFSFPAIQVPLRPPTEQAPPGDENQGVDMMTIGLDMFVGIPPPTEERGADPRDNADGADGADNGETGPGPAGGNGAANPNGLAQDLHSLIEGLLRTTRNIIPQVINGQGPVPPPAPNAPTADGAQPEPQPHTRPVPDAAGGEAGAPPPLPGGGPRVVPIFPLNPNMFRPTRPMPPRRERKTWSLPGAPGPSLRQRVEQREREQGLRCSDTSCGVGPSDDDPFPELSASSAKQVFIRPIPGHEQDFDDQASVCAHAFHPECLVSAERVAGWGGEDRTATAPLVEVSCPVCRAVGCVTRDEWASGVSAL